MPEISGSEVQDPREWLLLAVHFYRELGFFDPHQECSDVALADRLEALHKNKHDTGFDPADPYEDLSLVSLDKDRVWWKDTEADVCKDNEVYVQTLTEWGRISRGAFVPKNIKETWQDEEGPIRIQFELDGKQHCIQPEYQEDYIDVGIVNEINSLIVSSPYRFMMYEPFDQTAFVVVLTEGEAAKLGKERGWRFAS